jgi:hypothetical protein
MRERLFNVRMEVKEGIYDCVMGGKNLEVVSEYFICYVCDRLRVVV